MKEEAISMDRNLALEFVRVTEAAASLQQELWVRVTING